MMEQSQHKKEQQAYVKMKVIGEGSMGKVYLVKATADHKEYVMKRIHIGHLSEQEKDNARREAQLHSLISHPNIISFKEIYQTTKEKLCIIMEYADGGDLDQLIKAQNGKKFPQETVMNYFVQICLGLKAIHQKKIIHRDLKGANIFLNHDNQVKIGDFGISKTLDATVLASKSFVGTPYYLSPEMVEGKPYSTKADIWSLGIILYHLCALKLPFEANSLPLLALKILKGSFPAITGNEYSKEVKNLILNLLQVDSRKRPSIDEILAKPSIFKYLPKQYQDKMQVKPKLQAKTEKLKAMTQKSKKTLGSSSTKITAEDLKEKEKQSKEEARIKREERSSQMREDLKNKRKEALKEKKSSQLQNEPELTSQVIKPKQETLPPPPPPPVLPKKQDPTSETQKPWKNKKKSQKPKEIEVEMFLPSNKPKQKDPAPVLPVKPQKDIKVEIFVAKNPYLQQQQEKQQQKQVEQQAQKEEEYDSASQADSEGNLSSEEVKEDIECEQGSITQMMDRVRNAKNMVGNLQNPYENICLYQDSDNYDTTMNMHQKQELSGQEAANLKQPANSSSENVEQLRFRLQHQLGEENFIRAYKILQQHSEESSKIEKQLTTDKEEQRERNFFNRQAIKEKLNFLTDFQFEHNILFLYTLQALEDGQMMNNFES